MEYIAFIKNGIILLGEKCHHIANQRISLFHLIQIKRELNRFPWFEQFYESVIEIEINTNHEYKVVVVYIMKAFAKNEGESDRVVQEYGMFRII